MRSFLLSAVVLLASCTEQPLTTIESRCAYGEAVFEIVSYAGGRDVIMVIEREQARIAEPRLRALVSALITGAADDEGKRILRHDESVRLAIASPTEVADSVRDGVELPFIRYRYAPYGYADDLERFLDLLPCLYGADPAACADAAGEPPLEVARAEIIMIVDEGANVAAVELIASTVYEEQLARVAFDAPDYRPALFELENCSQFYPYGSHGIGLDREDFEIEDDGRHACRLFETLPASGPITRCEQLAAYGRRFEAIATDGVREVCEVDQVRKVDAEIRYGWLIPTEYQSRSSWPLDEPTLGCVEYRAMFEGVPSFTWISEPIADARLEMRCVLATGPEPPSCEDL